MSTIDPRRFLPLLPLLVAFQAISTDLYLPALPSLVADLGTDVASAQLTLSVFLVGFAISQLVYGPLSDRLGRRPLLLAGTALYAVASLLCVFAATIEQLVALRLLQAVGACAGPVLGRAVVRDVYGPQDAARVLAYLAAAMALAPAAGPILGGYLTLWFDWRACFLVLSLLGILALLGTWRLLPETNGRKDPHAMAPTRLAANYAELLGHPLYRRFVMVGVFGYGGIFAFISGSSYLLIGVVGLSPELYGMCFAAVVLGYMAGSLIAGRITGRVGIETMVRAGGLTCAMGGLAGLALALAMPPSVPSIVAPMAVFMVGAGFALPAATAGALGPFPTKAGLASALMGFAQLTLASLLGIAIGAVYGGTALPMMGALALVGCGALVAGLRLPRTAGATA
ncbi:multidrug effflux MFS transporter [Geminicoccaceae bacterium 1502E]|nr:multidrug effflux MFS transporter [Geminicoccaceae bacterium 1502E]